MLAIGTGGTAIFTTAHDPVGHAVVRTSQVMASASTPVALWGLIAVEEALPPDRDQLDQAAVVKVSVRLLRHQH